MDMSSSTVIQYTAEAEGDEGYCQVNVTPWPRRSGFDVCVSSDTEGHTFNLTTDQWLCLKAAVKMMRKWTEE